MRGPLWRPLLSHDLGQLSDLADGFGGSWKVIIRSAGLANSNCRRTTIDVSNGAGFDIFLVGRIQKRWGVVQVNCRAPYTVQMESETEKLGCCNARPPRPARSERLCMRNFRMSILRDGEQSRRSRANYSCTYPTNLFSPLCCG